MKKKSIILSCVLVAILMGCGKGQAPEPAESVTEEAESSMKSEEPSDDGFFTWDSNDKLLALSESGREQEALVIPAKCTGIEVSAFQSSAVKTITFEDDDDLGDLSSAFFGAANLTAIQLPANQKLIGDMAFGDCTALETITIPASVEAIGNYAFSGCTSLKEIEFEGTALKNIGENAFEYCALSSLVLPEGVENIKMYGFYGNKNLVTVTLPSTIKTIEDGAFEECPITEVHMHKDMQPDSISFMAFGSTFDSMVVYISEGSWLDKNREAWTGLIQNINYE